MSLNYDTTWIGLLGGGISGSILAGGSVFQIDAWHMGGNPLPARVLVVGKRVGLVAEIGAAHAMLIVTGCRSSHELHNIVSSGLDWELAAVLKGSAIVKTGAKIFSTLAAEATAETAKWATNESAKRMVQWMMDDLGIVKPGKQFNLLPSPLALAAGAGIFYDHQTLKLLSGNIGWEYVSPEWYVESDNGDLRLQLHNIPEQDGEKVLFGLSVPKWGFDPFIRWKQSPGAIHTSRHDFHIIGYSYGGVLYERRDGSGPSGINLSNLEPVGRFETGIFDTALTPKVVKGGTLDVRPIVFKYANLPYWAADDSVEMTLDEEGYFVGAKDADKLRS